MGRLTAIVLGSAAGGGFPQWNCRCPTCLLAWAGDARVRPRTQASLALTGAEIDQVAGLLSLREREAFTLYATAATLAALADNAMFAVLAPDLVIRRAAVPGESLALPGGLQAQLFLVPGKVPLYLEDENPETASETAANVGVELSCGGARMAYIPGAAAVTAAMVERIARADAVFFDGTLFRDDEMIASGTGTKTGRRMGHMPIAGAGGSLDALGRVAARRIYLHINNTNPILVEGSPERLQVERAGWEIAEDGMEIAL